MAAAPQPTVGILPEEADLHTAEARVNKHKTDWRGWKFMWPFAVVFVFVYPPFSKTLRLQYHTFGQNTSKTVKFREKVPPRLANRPKVW